MSSEDIVAVIFPLPEEQANRLVNNEKQVYAKYLSRHLKNTRVSENLKILIYVSGGKREIIGDGVIHSIEFLKPSDILSKYPNEFYLSKKELVAYTKRSKKRDSNKKLLVLRLVKLRKFQKPLKYDSHMTMAGKLLTLSEYNKIKIR